MNQLPPNQLDLSKFGKIVPLDDAEEIASRSKSLTAIRGAFENFFKLTEAFVYDLKTYDEKIQYLSEIEKALKGFEFDLSKKERELALREEQLKQQKEYIDKRNDELKAIDTKK